MFKYLAHTANYGAIYTVAATSSHATYPIANIQNQRLSRVWRSDTAVVTNVDITIDLINAREVDIIGLANNNFSASATVQIDAGTTTSVLDFSTTMTWRQFTSFKLLSPSQSYRYWRIRINDPSNADGFLEVGYLLLGLVETTPRGIAYEPGLLIDHISDVNVETTDGGAIFADFIVDMKRISVTFTAMTDTEGDTLMSFTSALKEETNPVFVIPRHDRYDGWYMRLVSTPGDRKQLYRSVSLVFLEEPGGKWMAA
jgi:hypothetical protein